MSSIRSLAVTLGCCMLLPTATIYGQLLPAETGVYSQFNVNSRLDLASQPEANDRIGSDLAAGDFNNDGFADLVVGCAFEDYGAPGSEVVDPGWVSVLYGGPSGTDGSIEDLWDQQGDVEGGQEDGDRVGFTTVTGDFNGDTFMDLVMSSPTEAIGSTSNAGSINVIYGSSEGLQVAGNRQLYQGRDINGELVPGASEANDQFGYSLAVGDFNDDGRDDLAIGVPNEDLELNPTVDGAGAIVVLYGRPVIGLDPENAQGINRTWPGMIESPGAGDAFGWSLAVGNFNGDDYDDLAIGVPEDSNATTNAGSVDVIYGGDNGLDTNTNEIWTLDSPDVAGEARGNDGFGLALTAGNFDGDLYDDLAIGIPDRATSEGNNEISEHGAVSILYGTGTGLSGVDSLYLEQGLGGAPSFNENGDSFGERLATGDVNGDGADELLVGVPGERVFFGASGRDSAGAAFLFHGGLIGLSSTAVEVFDYLRIGEPQSSDAFGQRMTLGDFDGDGKDDIAVAVPRRGVLNASDSLISAAGEIHVMHTGWIFTDGFETGSLDGWSEASP